jgi:UDP-N-acetylglucosamine 2-epimerase (non-hydrolysing)/GDP/UDP-N,N'-diacetylbacillosamine 2-epimerase (hydrolysing)
LIPFFELAEQDLGVDLRVIVTDMHLSEAFGRTISEVNTWVQHVYEVPMDQTDGRPVSRATALGRALSGIAQVLDELRPDVLMVLGDRGETIATAVAALHLGIPIAHIQGGDVSGNVDEAIRHAITKMAHLHFPASEESAERIRRMGEEPWRIQVVGDPHIDGIVSGRYTPGPEVRRKYRIDAQEPFLLVLFHPETLADAAISRDSMISIMRTVATRRMRTLVVYPCSDHGYEGIVEAIEAHSGAHWISIHRNIEAVDFWGLQSVAAALIGNSSAGLIEAPYFNLPAVNVGRRQEGRLRWANVIDTSAEPAALEASLAKALSPQFRESLRDGPPKPFGKGDACCRMLEILKSVPLDTRLMNKRMTF